MRNWWFFLLGMLLVAALAVVVCFVGILYLRREDRVEVDDELDKIASGFTKIREAAARMFEGVHYFWCFALIYFWKARFYARKSIPWIVLVTFVFAGLSALLEGIVKISDWAADHGYAYQLASPTAKAISGFLLDAKLALHSFYDKPSLLIILFVCESLIIWHHIREHLHRDRERKTVDKILNLFHPLNKVCVYLNIADQVTLDPEDRKKKKNDQIELFLDHFSGVLAVVFREHGIHTLNVCVMLIEDSTEDMVAVYESSKELDFKLGYRLPKGKGAAGRSVEKNQSIYVPNVNYEHAVSVTDHVNKVLSRVYEKSENPFKSIISTPIMVTTGTGSTTNPDEPITPGSASKIIGVLNLSSRRRSPFVEFDFTIARLGARVLALMYNHGGY